MTKLIYTAHLTQSGASNTVWIKALQDDFGGKWARTGAGVFTYTKGGAFPKGKTVPIKATGTDENGNTLSLVWTSEDVLTLTTSDSSTLPLTGVDGILSDTYINFEVYGDI